MPHQPNSDNPSKEESEYKRPDMIIIDDRALQTGDYQERGQSSFDSNIDSETGKEKHPPKTKQPLRFICFLGLIFCVIFGAGIFLLSLLLSVLSIVSLFRNRQWRKGSLDCWRMFIHTTVAGFGFLLGLLNPSLGLGLIAIYFSLSRESMNQDTLQKILARAFRKL